MDTRAARLIEALPSLDTRIDLRCAVVEYYRAEGISKVSYHGYNSDGSPREPTGEGFPEDWIEHYADAHLDRVDPGPFLASQRVEPFRWSEAPDLVSLTEEMRDYLEEARRAGVGEGLAMAVFGPNLRNAYVALGFEDEDFDPDPAKVREFQFVAQAGHLRFCALLDRDAAGEKELSAREHEVLVLIARGKSNGTIGTLLEISTHTVDAHLRKIYEKLGVNDRTSAALIAIRKGLLQYPVRD